MIETTQNKILNKKIISKIIFGLMFVLGIMLTPNIVKAAHFSDGFFDLDIQLNKSSYSPGETVTLTGDIYYTQGWTAYAEVYINDSFVWSGEPTPNGGGGELNSATFSASNDPGSHTVVVYLYNSFNGTDHYYDLDYMVDVPSGCSGTSWGDIPDGNFVTAYSSPTVSYGSACSSISQRRTCSNGSLDGSYLYTSCSVDSPANCYVSPWGWINHNSSVTAYVSEAVPYGSACFETTRTCNNGTLSGSEAAYASCSVRNACYPSVDPSGYTNACSATNSCSGTNYGTIQCSGSCSVSAPANPSYYGNACSKSSTYSCNVTNGTFGCAGNNLSSNCSAATPAADPYTPGAACNRNICVGTGTIDNACTGHCSAAAPTLYGTAACYNTNVCGSGPAGAINNCTGACEGAGAAPTQYGTAACNPSCGTGYSIATQGNINNCSGACVGGSCSANSCTGTPWGTMTSGTSNTAWSTATPTYSTTCASIAQTRTCTAGNLGGSSTATSCVQGCGDGTFGNFANGGTTTGWAAASPSGAGCSSATRTCTGGSVSAFGALDNTGYASGSCTSGCSDASLGSFTSGQGKTAYVSASPAGACSSATVTCSGNANSGTLGSLNNASYRAASCTAGCASTPWGAVSTGYSNTAYASATPAGACSGETRTCTAGNLSGNNTATGCTAGCASTPWGAVSTGYSNTAYAESLPTGACSPQTRTCTAGTLSGSYTITGCNAGCTGTLWGNVSHGYSNTAYSTSSVAWNASCASQTRSCSNGTFSGTYGYTSCAPVAPLNCTGTWGTVNHGSALTTYTTSEATYPTTCASNGSQTCTNGAGVSGYASCTQKTNGTCNNATAFACSYGTSVSNVTNPSNWTWGCNGINGGTSTGATSCSLTKAACTGTWGTVASGSSLTTYTTSAATSPGSTCTSNGSQLCNNGAGVSGYASCTQYYTATFNSNGGTPTYSTATYTAGANVTSPGSPTRTGYSFTSWGLGVMPAANTTYTAQWGANPYGVTWNGNAGGTSSGVATCTYNTTVTPTCSPSAGYTTATCAAFTCGLTNSFTPTFTANTNNTVTWNANTGGTSSGVATCTTATTVTPTCTPSTGYAKNACAAFTCVAGSNSFTPTFTPQTYAVTWNANTGGTSSGVATCTYNTTVTPTCTPSAGYSTATCAAFTCSTSNSFTPTFSPNPYSITFTSNGGTAVTTITQNYGTTVTAPAAPTKTGYTFASWSPAIATTMPVGGQALTATWTANNYTITFDSAGGTTVTAITQAYASAVIAPTAPTKTGYTFAGWSPTVPTTMGLSQTLTAQWTINSYTYTFAGNGATTNASPLSVTQNYTTSIATPTSPARTGYTFTGWSPAIPATMPVNGGTSTAQWTQNIQSALTVTSTSGTYPTSITMTTSGGSGGGAVSYTTSNGTATGCTITGAVLSFSSAGTCSVTATKAADNVTYLLPVSSSATTVTIAKASQTTPAVTAQTINYGQTFGALAATGGESTGGYVFALGAAGSAGCSVSGTTLSFGTAGTCTVTVYKQGDGNYVVSSTSVAQTFTVNQIGQTAWLTDTSSAVYTGGAITRNVACTSGTPSPATVSGTTVGTYSATISCSATTNYYATGSLNSGSFSITKANQTTPAVTAQTINYGQIFGALAATGGSSTGGYVFALASAGSAGCSVAGTTLSFSTAGTCTVTVYKQGDGNYNTSSTSAAQAFTINKINPSPVMTVNNSATYDGGGKSATLTLTGTAGATSNILTGGATTQTAAGSYAVTANFTPTDQTNYNNLTAYAAVGNFVINTAAQTVYFTNTSSVTYTGETITKPIACSGGGTPTPSTTGGINVGSYSGSGISCSAVGNYALTNTLTTTNSFSITIAAQATLTSSATTGPWSGSITVSATGGSTAGTLTYYASAGTASGCSIVSSTGVLTATSAGTCSVYATMAANTNYLLATSGTITATFTARAQATVTLGAQTVTYTPAGNNFTTLGAAGGTGTGAYSYAVTSAGAGCALAGAVLSYTSAGTCGVTATRALDGNYNVASSTQTTFTINQGTSPIILAAQTVTYVVAGNNFAALSLSTPGAGTGAVTYAVTTPGAGCSITGTTLTYTSAGTCGVIASKVADTNYLSSTSAQTFTISKATPTALTLITASGIYPGFTVTSTGGVGNTSPTTYTVANGSATGCTINSTTGALTVTTVGTCTVTMNEVTDTNWLASSGSGTATVSKATPTATLAVSNSPVTYDGTAKTATVSVSVSSVGGSATSISTGGASTQTTAGTYAVTATFTPTDTTNYNSLTLLSAGNFVISKATPTISVSNSPQNYTGTGLAATISGSVAGTSSSILTGGSATQINVGTYAVTANFAPTDSTNYNSLTAGAAGNFVINKINQPTLTVTSQTVTYPTTFTSLATTGGGGGGAVTFALGSAGTAGCSVSGTTLSFANAGTCTVTATKALDGNYNVTTSAAQTFTINTAPQTALTLTTTSTTYGSTLTLSTSGGLGTGSVSYFVNSGSCTISGAILTPTSAGTCSVTATKAADINYNTVSSPATTVTIDKASQATLTTTAQTVTYGTEFVALTSTGGYGAGAVTFAITSAETAGCSISGTTLSYTNAGTCTVTATKATDTNYLVASSAAQTFTISKASQAGLTITTVTATYGTDLTLATSGGSSTGGVSYVVSSGSCTVSGDTLTPTSQGSCSVTATKASDINYNSVSSSATTITLVQKQLTISNPTLTITKIYDGNTSAVVAVGTLSGRESGDTVTVSATATYDTSLVGSSKTITVVYTLAGTDAGKYIKPGNYTVATGKILAVLSYLAGDNGTLTGNTSQTVSYGESGTAVTAVPNTGYHFVDWSDDSVSNPRTDTLVTASKSVTANFAIDTFTITASSGLNGTITPAGVTTKDYGTSQVYAITPSATYHTVDVVVDGVSQGAITSYTFNSIVGTHTISASFAINTYLVSATANVGGTITPTSISINHGSVAVFTVTPNSGYSVSVSGCEGSLVGVTYTTSIVTEACTVVATFTGSIPILNNPTATSVFAYKATLGASVVSLGGPASISVRGICYGTTENPTDCVSATGVIAGSYSLNVTSLTMCTFYYYRGFATNTTGIGYSAGGTFTTPCISLPTVTTSAASNVLINTTIAVGNITNYGGELNEKRGFVYHTSSHLDPGNTAPDNSLYANKSEETGEFTSGSFAILLSGLTENTTYYVRAYSYNSLGYSYGAEVSFKTEVSPIITQSEYKIFSNLNSTDVGGALGSQNTGAVLANSGDSFRLRLNLLVSGSTLPYGGKNFKLQYAERVGSCDVGFAGENYLDITRSTNLAYYNNFSADSGSLLTTNSADPIHLSDTAINQTYVDGSGFFTNSISQIQVEQYGKWDFSLYDKGNISNKTYCLRVVNSDGSALDYYSVIPQITTVNYKSRAGSSATSTSSENGNILDDESGDIIDPDDIQTGGGQSGGDDIDEPIIPPPSGGTGDGEDQGGGGDLSYLNNKLHSIFSLSSFSFLKNLVLAMAYNPYAKK